MDRARAAVPVELLSAPEIGPVADAISLYQAVAASGALLIGKRRPR